MTQSVEEALCIQRINELRLVFERDAKPYVDRLVSIRNLRGSEPLTVPLHCLDDLQELRDAPRRAAGPAG